jgi:hypothetical protein
MKLQWCYWSYFYIVSLFSCAFAWISILYLALHVQGAECKKTNKYLSFGALIYSWYPTTYVDFIAFCWNHYCKKLLIIPLCHPALGKSELACPKTKNYNHLEMSWHFSPNTDKNHSITSTNSTIDKAAAYLIRLHTVWGDTLNLRS